ncbi:uncharacterized protein LOC129920000 [Episyrphus balteatus]|uniref:uncharacterized protein LOC129920000 n=1 Tax=Episyrphus balteatus TaxID=286459 RepID=UPI00248570EF|nr:uncharacterized protein LOC129920000 [Episyrphus balteatus]
MNALPLLLLAIIGLTRGELLASVCKRPSGEYEVANINNCSTFIKCHGHNATGLSCLDGKLFDTKLRICRSPSQALCAVNDIPNYVHDLCKTMPKNELVPGIECDKYYKCNGINTTALACPNGQHYSRAYATCTNPIIAGCKALSDMCSGEYKGYAFPSLVCDEYFVCNRKLKPEPKTCDEGLYFSPNQQNCTQPALSGCSNDNGETTDDPNGNCDNAPVPKCDSTNSGAFFPHPNPALFYMCFNSKPLELQCETGLTYDTLLKYCVKEGANRVC